MARFQNEIEIHASPEAVFDELSDQRHEMRWSPKMRSVELLTREPITVGSRLRARWAGTPDNDVVYTDYTRPERWVMRFTSWLIVSETAVDLTPTATGTRLLSTWNMRLRGPLRPLMAGRTQLEQGGRPEHQIRQGACRTGRRALRDMTDRRRWPAPQRDRPSDLPAGADQAGGRRGQRGDSTVTALRVAGGTVYLALGIGFGAGAAVTLPHFARHGELPMTPWGFRSMSGPFEGLGAGRFSMLSWSFAAVCAWMCWPTSGFGKGGGAAPGWEW